MFDIEKERCNYFVGYPCGCNEHYNFKTFKSREDFLTFLESVCSEFETNTITERFPLLSGIGIGDDLESFYIYNFHVANPNVKPIKIRWIGLGSLHAMFKSEDKKERFPIIVKKNIRCIKSKDTSSFYERCMAVIDDDVLA